MKFSASVNFAASLDSPDFLFTSSSLVPVPTIALPLIKRF
jgi:hypothetical protein